MAVHTVLVMWRMEVEADDRASLEYRARSRVEHGMAGAPTVIEIGPEDSPAAAVTATQSTQPGAHQQ